MLNYAMVFLDYLFLVHMYTGRSTVIGHETIVDTLNVVDRRFCFMEQVISVLAGYNFHTAV